MAGNCEEEEDAREPKLVDDRTDGLDEDEATFPSEEGSGLGDRELSHGAGDGAAEMGGVGPL